MVAVSGIAVHGPSLVSGGGGTGATTQIPKVPGLSLPYSHTLTQTVLPGVKPVAFIIGISPFVLASSSHAISMSALQLAPLYIAMPPSVITPVCVSKLRAPPAGTVTLNHTSLPW